MANFEGVFIPITTPFRADDVTPERLQANVRRWNATALKGYVVLGSTGEFPMLSEAERDQILIAARERSEERRVGKSVDLGGRRIIKKKKKKNRRTQRGDSRRTR